jgi:D-alanyl-D-alanine carboxypeptidase
MHPRRNHIYALSLLLLVSFAARADKVDDFVKAEMQRQHVPGVSIAVIKDRKIVKSVGYGQANVELNVPATAETVYKIGSVSKQFIASGIMLLVKEGKIGLDDNVSKYLEGTPDSWKPITIRHLLTHTSGIVREAPGFDPFKVQNDVDVIKTAFGLPLRFSPGEKWEYCNVGYFTLAEIIHKVTGQPWGDFLRDRFFAPLDMEATRTTTITDLVVNRANGYVWQNGKFENAPNYFALRPSGAFLSTVTDLAKWEAALDSYKILDQASLDQMWTPVKLNDGSTYSYGFGWELDSIAGHKQIHHGGSLPGFRSQFARFVDDKLSVIVLTNGDNADAALFAVGVANFYIQNLVPNRIVVKVDPKILDAYVGHYQGTSVIDITREGGNLVIQTGADKEKVGLFPTSENSFFIEDQLLVTYVFKKDEAGQPILVVMRDGKEVRRIKKIN